MLRQFGYEKGGNLPRAVGVSPAQRHLMPHPIDGRWSGSTGRRRARRRPPLGRQRPSPVGRSGGGSRRAGRGRRVDARRRRRTCQACRPRRRRGRRPGSGRRGTETSSRGGEPGDHLIGSVLRVGNGVIAGDADHRDAPIAEVPTERGEPGGDVLDIRAVVTDEGDDKRGTRQLFEADRGAGGGLGQRKRRRGSAEGEQSGLSGHASQSRSTTRRPAMIAECGARPTRLDGLHEDHVTFVGVRISAAGRQDRCDHPSS